ncbi:MAG TPA: lamin tail domain-containing protein, partial [Myxococcota bacterium]|nr:lamin tail domain-containing protein [Myxococcota bacterium]
MRNPPATRRRGLLAALGLVALAGCQPGGSLGSRQEALTIHVPGDFATIQEALDAAAMDDIVEVAAGEYFESVLVQPGLILMGAGMDRTVLHGRIMLESGDHHVITGFRVTREGTTLSVNAGGIAKDCTGRPGVTLTENQIDGFGTGIALAECPQNVLTRNLLKRNQRGMVLGDSGGQLTDNLVLYNQKAGIVLNGCGLNVSQNTFVGNGFAEPIAEGGAALVTTGSNIDHAHNNIVVSNHGGWNLLEIANPNLTHNLVWGNTVDYAGQAVADPGDLSADPLFVDLGNDDFHLRPGSPAMDTGSDHDGTEVDFDGVSRPQGAAVDLGAYEQRAAPADRRLVISEVLANPVDEDRGEFVEIYNASADPIELAGLVLSDGDARDTLGAFQGGATIVPPAAYAVVLDPEYLDGYGIPAGTVIVAPQNSTLGNGLSTNDQLTLYDADGVTALSTFEHPFDPGNGVSAERVDLQRPDAETNWRASPCTQSAGRPNCAPVTLADGLILSEIMSNPLDESSGEFIELYNGTDAP